MPDDRPFVIESPTRVRLGPIAREFAREWGWSDAQMAAYLLKQNALQDAPQDTGVEVTMCKTTEARNHDDPLRR